MRALGCGAHPQTLDKRRTCKILGSNWKRSTSLRGPVACGLGPLFFGGGGSCAGGDRPQSLANDCCACGTHCRSDGELTMSMRYSSGHSNPLPFGSARISRAAFWRDPVRNRSWLRPPFAAAYRHRVCYRLWRPASCGTRARQRRGSDRRDPGFLLRLARTGHHRHLGALGFQFVDPRRPLRR